MQLNSELNAVVDRSIGCLAGVLVGDDNGGPANMMMESLEAILIHNIVNTRDIGELYLKWFRSDGYDAGITTHKALSYVETGLSFTEAVEQTHKDLDGRTAGISPAHRSVSLAVLFSYWYVNSPNFFEEFPNTGFHDFKDTVRREARLTHFHNEASEVSMAVNAICMRFIVGGDLFKSIPFGMNFLTTDWSMDIFGYLESLAVDDLSNSGYAPDVLISALWFLLNTRSFEEAMQQSKEFSGVANYCPVLVGSIGGAMYGYEGVKTCINASHINHLKRVKLAVNHIANKCD